MNKPEPKYPVGTRVRIVNENYRNGEVGYVDKIKASTVLNEFTGHTYYIQFKGGAVASFFEANIKEEPHTALLKKQGSAEYTETIRNIGAISTVFTESETCEFYKESADLSSIRAVTRKDVTSKHFTDWFFKMDDFAGISPNQFPFSLITHGVKYQKAYGYFNGGKLDGIIRVGEHIDHYELSFFFVNKSLQQQGIGQCLFQYVLKRFTDKKLILYVYKDNNPAIHIYKKYGFNVAGVDYGKGYKPKSAHYIMQRDVR
jgi:ribosomal protein S18 acetylase RimI-like enzyme